MLDPWTFLAIGTDLLFGAGCFFYGRAYELRKLRRLRENEQVITLGDKPLMIRPGETIRVRIPDPDALAASNQTFLRFHLEYRQVDHPGRERGN